jgi:hypothetical protein
LGEILSASQQPWINDFETTGVSENGDQSNGHCFMFNGFKKMSVSLWCSENSTGLSTARRMETQPLLFWLHLAWARGAAIPQVPGRLAEELIHIDLHPKIGHVLEISWNLLYVLY